MSNIRGLGDYGKDEKNKDKKKKESYIGGEKSGLAVEDASDDDDLQKIVKRAKQGSEARDDAGDRPSAPSGQKVSKKITLYKNGFVIDDDHEDFRQYDTPENKKFIQDLSEGYVPQELLKKHPKGVDCALEDKRGEDYKLPPYMKFKGQSTSIGGPSNQAKVQSFGYTPNEGKPLVDQSKPKTSIQIRFHNGQRTVLEVNEDCTLEEVYNYVAVAAPVDRDFELISGFPPVALTQHSQTLKQLNLLNSAITQKIL